MKAVYTKRFENSFEDLEAPSQEKVIKAVQLLLEQPRHPSLRLKKMSGTEHIWEARASRDLRITLEIYDQTVLFRNCGHHDKTLRNP